MGKKKKNRIQEWEDEMEDELEDVELDSTSKNVPVIKIHPRAWMKMVYYTKHCPYEIGGLIIADGLNVIDVVLPHQKVSGASVDYDMDNLHKMIHEIIKTAPQLMPKIKGTWHSHANLGASFSSTDEETACDFAKMGKYAISVVTDKDGKAVVKLHALVPIFHVPVGIDRVGWIIDIGDADLEEECKNQSKERVKKEVYN